MKYALLTSGDKSAALAKLAPIIDKARTFAASSLSPRTRDAYQYQWAAFTGWCAAHDLSPMPADPETLAMYLSDRADPSDGAKPWKVSTLSQALSAISEAHKASDQKSPRSASVVQKIWKGIRRDLGTAPRRVAPAVLNNLKAMVGSLPQEQNKALSTARTRALLIVGFAGAFRRSELVALQVDDVEFTSDGHGLIVTIRKSKTDQEGAGATVGLPSGSDSSTCPVRTLRAWLELSGVVDGPLFRSVSCYGRVGQALTGRSVARIVKSAAQAAGLDASKYSGHSLRAGLATTAAKQGKSDRAIMAQGRWSSRMMLDRYVREATLLDNDNAAAGIGL